MPTCLGSDIYSFFVDTSQSLRRWQGKCSSSLERWIRDLRTQLMCVALMATVLLPVPVTEINAGECFTVTQTWIRFGRECPRGEGRWGTGQESLLDLRNSCASVLDPVWTDRVMRGWHSGEPRAGRGWAWGLTQLDWTRILPRLWQPKGKGLLSSFFPLRVGTRFSITSNHWELDSEPLINMSLVVVPALCTHMCMQTHTAPVLPSQTHFRIWMELETWISLGPGGLVTLHAFLHHWKAPFKSDTE